MQLATIVAPCNLSPTGRVAAINDGPSWHMEHLKGAGNYVPLPIAADC